MTVVGEDAIMRTATGHVRCEWFDDKMKPVTGRFSETSLTVIDDDHDTLKAKSVSGRAS